MPDDITGAAPAAAEAPDAPAGESTDDIVSDILKGEAEDDAPDTEAEPEASEAETEPVVEDEDDAEEVDEADDDAAELGDADGVLGEARKALADGDFDKAFKLAFGKKPEQLLPNNKTWTQWRAANDRQKRAFDQRERDVGVQTQQFQAWAQGERQKIHHTIEQLRPYEEIHNARLAFRRDGDPELLKQIIEKTAEMPYDEAQKIILTKTRRTPGERLLAQRLAEVEQRLQAATATKSEQEQQQTQAQAYTADLAHIRGKVTGEITKVPRFAERIYNVLVKTRSSVGLTKTPEEAGRMVLAAERRKLAKHPLLTKKVPKDVSEAARKLARNKTKNRAAPLLRRNSQNSGAPNKDEESTDDIVSDILKNKRRAV